VVRIAAGKKTIVLGVTGSIAAYKSAELASLLVKQGHEVFVVMTQDATEFISPLTLQTQKRVGVQVTSILPTARTCCSLRPRPRM